MYFYNAIILSTLSIILMTLLLKLPKMLHTNRDIFPYYDHFLS